MNTQGATNNSINTIMTYFKKEFSGSPAIWCEDGLVAVFELEEERDLFLIAINNYKENK